MHLTVLSRSLAIYTTRRLIDAARIAGHRIRVIDPLRSELYLYARHNKLAYGKRAFPRTDVCIPRIGQSIQEYGLAVLDHLVGKGIPSLNEPWAIAHSRNKVRCLQYLCANQVRVAATAVATRSKTTKEHSENTRDMVKKLGGCPVLIKMLLARDRAGMMVCETIQSTEATLEALVKLGYNVLVQKYVQGRDLRAVVVGGRLVAIVRRVPRTGRLHRTLAVGAKFEAVKQTKELVGLAERAARLVGLEVAAVDMFDSADGPKVFDLNSSPGINEIETATGIDIAKSMIERAVELAQLGRAERRR